MKEASKKRKNKRNKPKKDTASKLLFFDRDFLKLEYRFKNNTEKWFSLILHDNCDLCENYSRVQYELENIFGKDVVYFLPIYIEQVENKLVGVDLFDGYIFVKKDDCIDEDCFTGKNDFFDSVLKTGASSLTNRDINTFKTKLKKKLDKRLPKKGDKVVVLEGTFKNMTGNVLSVRKDRTIRVEFRKKTRVVETVLGVANLIRSED